MDETQDAWRRCRDLQRETSSAPQSGTRYGDVRTVVAPNPYGVGLNLYCHLNGSTSCAQRRVPTFMPRCAGHALARVSRSPKFAAGFTPRGNERCIALPGWSHYPIPLPTICMSSSAERWRSSFSMPPESRASAISRLRVSMWWMFSSMVPRQMSGWIITWFFWPMR